MIRLYSLCNRPTANLGWWRWGRVKANRIVSVWLIISLRLSGPRRFCSVGLAKDQAGAIAASSIWGPSAPIFFDCDWHKHEFRDP